MYLLGYNKSSTNEIFTHANTKSIYQINSPFDDLEKNSSFFRYNNETNLR